MEIQQRPAHRRHSIFWSTRSARTAKQAPLPFRAKAGQGFAWSLHDRTVVLQAVVHWFPTSPIKNWSAHCLLLCQLPKQTEQFEIPLESLKKCVQSEIVCLPQTLKKLQTA